MSALLKVGDLGQGGADESRRVFSFAAPMQRDPYDKKFKAAFLRMLRDPNEKGLMSTHLFHDLAASSDIFSQLPYNPQVLSGGKAWEERIKDAMNQGAKGGYWSNDQSVTRYAIENGLIDKLPRGYVKFISYGGGDEHAFRGNELQVMDAVFKARKNDITGFCSVDILERFAGQCALSARAQFRIAAHSVVGDFIYNGKLDLPEIRGTPIVMIYGGAFENTPSVSDSATSQDITALAWVKLNEQYSEGVSVIKTFDTNRTPDLNNGPYAPKKQMEAFMLSAFARAVEQGIIEDKQYDVFGHWKLKSSFNNATNSIELAAECKRDHTVSIDGSDMRFEQGFSRVLTLSHKWDIETHRRIAERAGFDCEFYVEPNNLNVLMLAKSSRRPEASLMEVSI